MAHCVEHTQCPSCVEKGNDRSGNNLAVYSDGSCFCFSCGYFQTSKGIQRFQTRSNPSIQSVVLPDDVDDTLPERAWLFLEQYGIRGTDASLNTILWSERYKRIIFPYFTGDRLIAWQGRYLGTDKKAKWFSQGKLTELVHPVGNKHSRTCVLVEDIISAIRVGHNTDICAIPLFGSHVSVQRILQLKLFYDTIVVWLDMDKATESVRFCKKIADFGVKSRCIITDLDPKCYSDSEIKELTSNGISATLN